MDIDTIVKLGILVNTLILPPVYFLARMGWKIYQMMTQFDQRLRHVERKLNVNPREEYQTIP